MTAQSKNVQTFNLLLLRISCCSNKFAINVELVFIDKRRQFAMSVVIVSCVIYEEILRTSARIGETERAGGREQLSGERRVSSFGLHRS